MERPRGIEINSEHVGEVFVGSHVGHPATGDDHHAIRQTARVRTPGPRHLGERERRFLPAVPLAAIGKGMGGKDSVIGEAGVEPPRSVRDGFPCVRSVDLGHQVAAQQVEHPLPGHLAVFTNREDVYTTPSRLVNPSSRNRFSSHQRGGSVLYAAGQECPAQPAYLPEPQGFPESPPPIGPV